MNELPPFPWGDDLTAWLEGRNDAEVEEALKAYARDMKAVIDDYRKAHPEEYEFTELAQARGMAETFKAELIAARQELAHYKEREKTMGWAE